jgi:hypothetical protein
MAFGNQNQIKNSILRTSRYGSFLYICWPGLKLGLPCLGSSLFCTLLVALDEPPVNGFHDELS